MSVDLTEIVSRVKQSGPEAKERYLNILEVMYTTRLVDDKMTKMIRQNKGGAFHLCVLGHEMIGAASAREVPHHSGGRMMPEHYSEKVLRIPSQSSCVGSQFLQAAGVAKALQLSGEDEVVYVSAGDGATSQVDFH